MCIPVLGWTLLGIIPTKYINRIIDEKSLRDKSKEKAINDEAKDNFASFVENKPVGPIHFRNLERWVLDRQWQRVFLFLVPW